MNFKRHTKQLALSALIFATVNTASAGAGWTDFGTISNLNQQPGSNLVFVDVGVTSNPSDAGTCTVRNGFYFSVTDDRKKRLFATLLAAQLSSRKVRVYTTGTCGQWGYAELDGLVVL